MIGDQKRLVVSLTFLWKSSWRS